MINLFNRVQTNSINVDAPAARRSAQITVAVAGSCGITQVMFRFSF